MKKRLFMETLGWGVILWLVGYLLGIILFFFVPLSAIGWIITPIGTVITIWILLKKVKSTSFQHYLIIALSWMAIAIVFDYIFLVKLFNPPDGYYKFNVFFYYGLMFFLPMLIGYAKNGRKMKGDI